MLRPRWLAPRRRERSACGAPLRTWLVAAIFAVAVLVVHPIVTYRFGGVKALEGTYRSRQMVLFLMERLHAPNVGACEPS